MNCSNVVPVYNNQEAKQEGEFCLTLLRIISHTEKHKQH